MLKVIFGISVVPFVIQIGGTSVVGDVQRFKFNNLANLNMEKMLGQWHVFRSNDGVDANSCYLIDFQKDQSNKFSMHQCKTIDGGFACINVTDLTISDRITGKRHYLNNTQSLDCEFVIHETDYDNYAVMEFKLNTNFVVILSRNNVFDARQLDKLTAKYMGIQSTRTYSRDDCPKNYATRTTWVDTKSD